ncbi:hypothetical protein G7Y79_00014g036560 [Physcia stellaris]|nr:hypothetical protein G7Y79_00014g036560 [Physcia stellaris]
MLLGNMFASDSCSDTSSERSLSPSPSPRLTFANPIAVPLKSLLSPPTTTDYFSISPATPPSCPFNSPNNHSVCAFPSWPSGDCLSTSITSPTTSSSPYNYMSKPASSHISDEDLIDLEELELRGQMRIPTGFPVMQLRGDGCIPWEATRQPPIVIKLDEGRREKTRSSTHSKPKNRKRKSTSLKDRRIVVKMSPIAEGTE